MNGNEWLIVLALFGLLAGLAYRSLGEASRMARTAVAAYLLLLLSIFAAIGARKYLASSWEEYQSIAAMFIGVGGIFLIVGLATDSERDSSNAAGLGAVGLGGIMIAFKEAVAPFADKQDFSIGDMEVTLGWEVFLKSTGLAFLTLIVLLLVGGEIQRRRLSKAGVVAEKETAS